ncbi:MAG: aminomethyl-transferring glycine dehydrogenase subunit GcvPA [Clostridiaceae bacterium]|jgi:glycine dehydrogenase subunit 1|nr:aminomethyl-transferring glycine dehydrogenase subunit GcvPA [Clostridiaceae bacterium]
MYRYIPNTREDQEKMLSAIGAGSVAELFSDIPEDIRLDRDLDLPDAMHEQELVSHMKAIASENVNTADHPCFLGAGVYDHFIPSVVGHVISRSEFYTSYTPYQPEISQGTLQAIFEYQTMICRLTGMDVSNASMYDGATAVAEAALMAVRSTGREKVLVSRGVHPQYREVLRTYAVHAGIGIAEVGLSGGMTDLDGLRDALSGEAGVAAVILQSPNFFGVIEDMEAATALAHEYGALTVACVDPVSLAILQPPGEYGADIAAGEGQPLGNPLNYGGPHFGFLAAKQKLVRKMPGRIVGQTADSEGRRGFVLTLQAREQHIRREKAVSNICSNQALNALAATVYLSVMGKQGLKQVAELCLSKSHYAYSKLLATGRFEKVCDAPFFREFAVRSVDEPVETINRRLRDRGMIGGLALERYYPEMKNCWLVAVTEKRTRQEIDAFVEAAAGGGR